MYAHLDTLVGTSCDTEMLDAVTELAGIDHVLG